MVKLPSKLKICVLSISLAIGGNASAQINSSQDLLLSTPGSPEVIQKGQRADGYSLAVMAYYWGYPLVRMERVVREYINVPSPKPATSYRAPLGQIGWATELASPDAKDMPAANNDTYYMSAVLNLTEPYVLTVPDTNDRYYVINVFNMWQELEHYVGRRVTGTKAGKYVLVPPGWKGELPKDAKRLDVSTSKVWLWGRLRVKQGEDTAPLFALQKKFTVAPLSGKAGATLPPLPKSANDEFAFFYDLAAVLKANPVKPADKALFAQFTRIGLTENGFDPSKLSAETRKGMAEGLADGPAAAISSLEGPSSSIRNGWTWVTDLDNFGFNYPMRALVSGPYLGGQGQREAMYPIRYTDSKGETLSGANQYVIKMDSPPPVGAFWSLTLYNADDKMLVANEIGRYKVGPDTPGLRTAPDGSITIPISHQKPTGENAAN
ncbi:DUF1254 domain-containing protein [Shewanella sp.]|uniref:DUF1254 domain-containing protein n=1 Tax=Shewanella sp. TaxID=50422 RepID=UPI003A8A5933